MEHCPNCGAKFESPDEKEPTCAFCGTHFTAEQISQLDTPLQPQKNTNPVATQQAVPLSSEGKKLISLIHLAQAAGNNREVYSLANQLIQQDIDSSDGYYYKAISTENVKEGWVLWEKLKSMNPRNAAYYIEAATNLGEIYISEYRREVTNINSWISHGKIFKDKVNNAWDECESHWPKFADNSIWSLDGYAKCIKFLDPILKIENNEVSLTFSAEEYAKAKETAEILIAKMKEGINFLLKGVSTGTFSSISCSENQISKLTALQKKYQNYFGETPTEAMSAKNEIKEGGCLKWTVIIIIIISILFVLPIIGFLIYYILKL